MELMQNSFQKSLIFDIGNATTKFGFSSDQRPNVFDTVIRTKLSRAGEMLPNELRITGKKATHSCLYKHDIPIKRGVLGPKEDFQVLIRFMLEEVKAKTLDNIPVFVCDSLNSSAEQRFRMAETLQGEFKASLMYFADQPTLALYGYGRTSGCLVDVGHGTTQVSCIYENFKISQCCDTLNLGGEDMENELAKLLYQNGTQINRDSEYSLLREIKEKYCELIPFEQKSKLKTQKFEKTLTSQNESVLPDGESIQLDEGQYSATEVLFNPSPVNSKLMGLHQFLKYTIERADLSLKNEFYSSIWVAGGVAQTKNFQQRLTSEFMNLCHPRTKVVINTKSENAGLEAWLGAKAVVTSNIYDFSNLWVTKNELAEVGQSIFYRKCL